MEPGGRTSRVLELLEPQQEARAKPVAWCAAGAGPTLRTESVGQGTFGRNRQGIPQGRSQAGHSSRAAPASVQGTCVAPAGQGA